MDEINTNIFVSVRHLNARKVTINKLLIEIDKLSRKNKNDIELLIKCKIQYSQLSSEMYFIGKLLEFYDVEHGIY